MAKNGWGAAKDGKVLTESNSEYNHTGSNPKSSKDLKGLYSKWQGKTLSEKSDQGD